LKKYSPLYILYRLRPSYHTAPQQPFRNEVSI
jgi:hypothetical protein